CITAHEACPCRNLLGTEKGMLAPHASINYDNRPALPVSGLPDRRGAHPFRIVTPEWIENLIDRRGLDEPLLAQLTEFLQSFFIDLDADDISLVEGSRNLEVICPQLAEEELLAVPRARRRDTLDRGRKQILPVLD